MYACVFITHTHARDHVHRRKRDDRWMNIDRLQVQILCLMQMGSHYLEEGTRVCGAHTPKSSRLHTHDDCHLSVHTHTRSVLPTGPAEAPLMTLPQGECVPSCIHMRACHAEMKPSVCTNRSWRLTKGNCAMVDSSPGT